MEQLFITNLTIEKVRHIQDISIPLAKDRIMHLILTGKNGSGKTSVLEAMSLYLGNISAHKSEICRKRRLDMDVTVKDGSSLVIDAEPEVNPDLAKRMLQYAKKMVQLQWSLNICFNREPDDISQSDILAYYEADRIFKAEQPRHVEKVQLKDSYGIEEFPRNEFVKYLLDLKMTEALARNSGKAEKADEIQAWFGNLEQLLKKVFADESIELAFDEDTFKFHILQHGREPFDFHTLSRGYQAVLDIILDVMMRMVNQTQRAFDFMLPGIVLIDEIETHLHLELQKSIMPLLTAIFPNIQFVVTTHSPFILNSLENAVIYDLENHTLVENGMNNLPYEGIVEGYFRADRMSEELQAKFRRYSELVQKERLSDDEISEIAELELYLDEIPDYLAIDVTTEYQRLKLEYMCREDIDG